MNGGRIDRWQALEGEWHYLGRDEPGALAIAVLSSEGAGVAPLFTSKGRALAMLRRAPPDTEVIGIGADDLRAKEEWLRAASAQGARDLCFDLSGDDGDDARAGPHPSAACSADPAERMTVEEALWYILSFRRATACL